MNSIDSRIEKLEKLVEGLSRKLEKVSRKFGDEFDFSIGKSSKKRTIHKRNNSFWGWALLGAGLLILNNNMGWFAVDFPVWSIVCILAGVYLIVKSRRND